MGQSRLSRRAVLKTAALVSAVAITAPYVSRAYAAGSLSLGCWDHWVPGANKASTDLVNEWAAKEKVEVQIDYITSQGNKLLLTATAEAQAKSGHDILAQQAWLPHANADLLEWLRGYNATTKRPVRLFGFDLPGGDRGGAAKMSIGRKTARAAAWAFASTAGAKLITLGSLAVLAHLLSPAEFGLLAFAMVYITYAETIGDLGSGMALVYWPDRRDDAAQVTFITNAAAGVMWCVITVAAAPLIAHFFHALGDRAHDGRRNIVAPTVLIHCFAAQLEHDAFINWCFCLHR